MTSALITVGITYMILGLPLFIEIYTKTITLKDVQRRIYSMLFVLGVILFACGLLSILFPSAWWSVMLVLSSIVIYRSATRMIKIALKPK